MANPFDQFDAPTQTPASAGGGNPFDQFDGVAAADQVRVAAGIKPQKTTQQAVDEALGAVDSARKRYTGVDAFLGGDTSIQQLDAALQPKTIPTQSSQVRLNAEGRPVTLSGSTGLDIFSSLNDPELLNQLAKTDLIDDEAAAYGLAQGTSFGFSDEVAGARDALINALTGGDKSFTEAYEEGRDASRKEAAAAKERSPFSYGAGEVTGALPVSGAAGAKVASRVAGKGAYTRAAAQGAAGAAEGALTGLGASEAELGDSQVYSDVLQGAALGGAFGAGGEFAGAGIDKLRTVLDGTESKKLIQDALLEAKPEGLSTQQYADRLDSQLTNLRKIAGDDNAALADLDELQNLVGQVGKLGRPSVEQSADIAARSQALETKAREVISPRFKEIDDITKATPLDLARGAVAGEPVQASDLVAGTERVRGGGERLDIPAFSKRIRQDVNEEVEGLYKEAYAKPTRAAERDQRDAINFYRSEYPDFKKYWDRGRSNALNSSTDRKSLVKATDAGIREISDDIQVAREAGQNAKVQRLTQTKSRMEEVLQNITPEVTDAQGNVYNPILEARRIGAEPRQLTKALDEGFQAVGQGDIRQLDRLQRSATQGTPTERLRRQEGRRIGAGQALEDRLDKGSRDSKTNRLLSEKQVSDYNRVVYGNPSGNLENYISADALAKRTANVAGKTPQTLLEELKSSIPALAKDVGSASALGAFIAAPNVITGGLLATRLGQAAVSRLTKKQLAKQGQKELLRLGVTKKELESILSGDFSSVSPDKVTKIARKLAAVSTVPAAIEGAATTEARESSVTGNR